MLNPIEEAKFAALEKNCQELGVPAPPSIYINFEVKDKNGDLIFTDKQRGHSWTRNFYNALFGIFAGVTGDGGTSFGAGYMSGKRYTEQITALNNYGAAFGAQTPAIVDTSQTTLKGIVVGTGATAFSAENFYMNTLIAHGNSAGQLSYNAMSVATKTYDSSAGAEKWTGALSRVFNNNSGGSIVVAEVGLMASGIIFINSAYNYLFERSVLSPTVTVPNGAQLTVTYEISMSFAAID